ncbi:MAG: 1-phosphofructokinase family hexose kinase, partial [Burkholderiales bacterium]|nr:1-phosphofructokinase family hexose kinase [Anaerolineae bacterium]
MIVTLTPNTTFDQTLLVPTFEKNRTIRATRTAQSMGGKPTDASFILGELGMPSLALGFAAGVIGRRVEAMLHARGVTTDFIEVGGETRINTIIVSQEGWQTAITTQSLEVTDAHVAALTQRFKQALDGATVVVTGGTLPLAMKPSWYADVISLARERSIPVIFDADEPNLSAGLVGSPNFAKPNRDELSALLGHEVTTKESAYRAGREMLERYGTAPIITLGSEGALAVLPDRAYFIPPIQVEVVSASGAGDGVLAGLASAISQ